VKPLNKKILYVVNVDWFFISHRLPIATQAVSKGFEVHVACRITSHGDLLKSHGLHVHPLEIPRSKISPISFIRTFIEMCNLFKLIKPDLVHLITIKPVLLGGIASRYCKVPAVVSAISGLGYIYISSGIYAKIRRFFTSFLYKAALSHKNMTVIFQNSNDLQEVTNISGLLKENTLMIKGSGVVISNFSNYLYEQEHKKNPIILMASRILADKGVYEFIQSAKIVKKNFSNSRFILAGMLDEENPTGISSREIHSFVENGLIEYFGHVSDIAQLLQKSYLVVLPSYREGMPKILLEAAAAGRAVITTNVPGCRDSIIHNETGLLVEPKNHKSLSNAILFLLESPDKTQEMGLAGRKLAEKNFNVDKVIKQHLNCYKDLLKIN